VDELSLIFGGVLLTALVVYLIHFLARNQSRSLADKAVNRTGDENCKPLIRPGFILVLAILVSGFLFLWFRPVIKTPAWYAKYRLRSEVNQRVQNIGGWNELIAIARSLAATNQPVVPTWIHPGGPGVLGAENLVELRASMIAVHPGFITNTVQINFLDGGRGRPRVSYTIFVAPDYPDDVAVQTFRLKYSQKSTIRPLAPGVFEIH
jgi:hypothetical protein